MRTILAIALTALIAGCAGTGNSPTTGEPSLSGTTTDASSNKTVEVTYSCFVRAGISGNANLNNGTGGCGLTSGIPADGTVKSLDLAGGCEAWYDDTPGDSMTTGFVNVGDDFSEGTALGVYCDATMAPNSESSLTMIYVS